MSIRDVLSAQELQAPVNTQRTARRGIGAKLLLHGVFLLLALACFAAYAHFELEGQSTSAMMSLVSAGVLGFAPLRDALRLLLKLEGKALHLAHGLGSLALVGLPLSGVVTGKPVLSHAWMAPFAMMGAAQAVTHQNNPRNAKQAAALQQFAASLPEVAQFADAKNLTSPANAQRAIAVLSEVLVKAQALGQTELDADRGFQGALKEATTRVGANLGLDAVDLALRNLAGNPAAGNALPGLQKRLAQARRTIAASGDR